MQKVFGIADIVRPAAVGIRSGKIAVIGGKPGKRGSGEGGFFLRWKKKRGMILSEDKILDIFSDEGIQLF